MAAYSSTEYTTNKPEPSHGLSGNVKCQRWTVTCAAAPATTDTINFGYLPAGARVLLAVLEASDMDTNGSPALALNIGDAGSAARLFSASTVGQAGTLSTAIAVAGANAAFTARTLITGVASTNAATGAAGTIDLAVFYTVEGLAS